MEEFEESKVTVPSTHFALLPVQIELVLTDGHHPNGLNQRVAGIPRVDDQASLPKGAFGHRPPAHKYKRTQAHMRLRSASCSGGNRICRNRLQSKKLYSVYIFKQYTTTVRGNLRTIAAILTPG